MKSLITNTLSSQPTQKISTLKSTTLKSEKIPSINMSFIVSRELILMDLSKLLEDTVILIKLELFFSLDGLVAISLLSLLKL